MSAAVVTLAFVGWLVGLQLVEVRRDEAPDRSPRVWIVTAALGLAAATVMSPHLFHLLT